MSVTLEDIAKKLKVSKMTVSRVLNKKESTFITEATRKRVMEVAQEMGYRPNMMARALVTGRTGRIAFWSPRMGARFFQEVAYRCHQLLQKKGYEMITGEFGPALLDPSHGIGLTRLDVDGVLMYGGSLGCLKPILESNFPMKAPIVNMGLHCVGSLDYVNIDLYSASRQGVEYLVGTGRKRIAHMLPEYTRNRADSRYCAYEDVLAESGMTPEYVIIQGWSSFDARESIKEYVKENGVPDGLFCANDEIAIGAYRGLRDLGVRIPDECALLGCDGINDLEFLDPPISTIAQPMEEMIATAWSFLQNRMASPNCPQQTKSLEASFVVRT